MNDQTKSFSDDYNRLNAISKKIQDGNLTDIDEIVSLVGEASSIYDRLQPKIKDGLRKVQELKSKIAESEGETNTESAD